MKKTFFFNFFSISLSKLTWFTWEKDAKFRLSFGFTLNQGINRFSLGLHPFDQSRSKRKVKVTQATHFICDDHLVVDYHKYRGAIRTYCHSSSVVPLLDLPCHFVQTIFKWNRMPLRLTDISISYKRCDLPRLLHSRFVNCLWQKKMVISVLCHPSIIFWACRWSMDLMVPEREKKK